MRLKIYLKLRRDLLQVFVPNELEAFFWAIHVLNSVYDKAPIYVIEGYIKNLAAHIFGRPLCGSLATAYLEGMFIAKVFKDRELEVYLEDKIKKLGVPYRVTHQPPVKQPYIMIYEDRED